MLEENAVNVHNFEDEDGGEEEKENEKEDRHGYSERIVNLTTRVNSARYFINVTIRS